MRRSNLQVALAVMLAAVVGFIVALVAFGNDNGNNAAVVTSETTAGTGATAPATTTTTATGTSSGTTATGTTTTTGGATPTTPAPTVASCIQLWNEPANRGAQVYLINLASRQPIRVHVGQTTDVPPKCLITVIANNGDAYVFPAAAGTTYPYAPAPSTTNGSSLPAEQRKVNALAQSDGTLAAS
jgi:hypothetical protein